MELGRLLPGVSPEHLGVRIGVAGVDDSSGVTVLIPPPGTTVGVDSRGGGPATHETDIARPGTLPFGADAVVLTGGSALGLAAARGVQERLAEAGIGTPVAGVRVPIVPAAAIFDIGRRPHHGSREDHRSGIPDASDGYWAAVHALGYDLTEEPSISSFRGSEGAGTAAWTGRGFSRGGMGYASIRTSSGAWVSAVVIANPMGTILSLCGELYAAQALSAYGLTLPGVDPAEVARLVATAAERGTSQEDARTNTTIAVICTDAGLTDSETTRLAASAHAGIARAVWPSHTMFDGDTVFALSTGERTENSAALLTELNIAAADALSAAIIDGVLSAEEALPWERDPDPFPDAFSTAFPELSQKWEEEAERRLGNLENSLHPEPEHTDEQ